MRLQLSDMEGPEPKASLCLRAVITIDGRKVEHCLLADEEDGIVIFYETDKHNNFIAGPDGSPEKRHQFGTVVITDPLNAK